MKQKIKISDIQAIMIPLRRFVSVRAAQCPSISAKGVIGTLTFMKRLSRMPHDSDFSEWEPILKRRLIRMLHVLIGYKDFPGFVERLYMTEDEVTNHVERCVKAMYNVLQQICDIAGAILKRLADVDGVSGSLHKFPGQY